MEDPKRKPYDGGLGGYSHLPSPRATDSVRKGSLVIHYANPMDDPNHPAPVIDIQHDFSTVESLPVYTVDPDWFCPACEGVVEALGCLGTRQHGRCRSCGLDSSRSNLPVLADPFPAGEAPVTFKFEPGVLKPAPDLEWGPHAITGPAPLPPTKTLFEELAAMGVTRPVFIPGTPMGQPSVEQSVRDMQAQNLTIDQQTCRHCHGRLRDHDGETHAFEPVEAHPEDQLLRDEEGDEPFANDWKPRS